MHDLQSSDSSYLTYFLTSPFSIGVGSSFWLAPVNIWTRSRP